jgi:hypothetical protein
VRSAHRRPRSPARRGDRRAPVTANPRVAATPAPPPRGSRMPGFADENVSFTARLPDRPGTGRRGSP